MSWGLLFAVFSVSISLVSAQACDAACQAYVWGYPLWHEINQRFMQNANSPAFAINAVSARVSSLQTSPYPQLALCNSTLCPGVVIPLFNPSPVVAPNVDTVYGALNWDLGPDDGAALSLVLLPLASSATPPQYAPIRYASIIFYDHYTNVVAEYAAAATNIPLCLTKATGNTNCPQGYLQQVLPHTGFAIVRGYSDGTPSPVPCGVNGCSYLLALANTFHVVSAPTSTVNYATKYSPYMTAPSGCPYVYGQPPCGPYNKNSFWDAICSAISDYPLSAAEAAYVDQNFNQFGIYSTGCTGVNYAVLNAGLTSGFSYVASKLYDPTTLVASGPWTFIPFSGNWAAGGTFAASNALLRAITSTRLEYMNTNNAAAYWEANTDSTGAPLNSAWGTTYKVVWQSNSAFVDQTRGFWSVTAYDSTHYLYNPPAGTDTRQYAVRGTSGVPSGEIHLSNVCVSATGCIRVTPGTFSIILRAYLPAATILPDSNGVVTYAFPTIVKCPCNAPCY